MLYTTAQVIEISGLSKDTLRHWKKVLKPLRYIDGRSRPYSLPELIAVCLIAHGTQGLGLPISRFAEYDEYIFNRLEPQFTSNGYPKILCITPTLIEYSDRLFPNRDIDVAIAYIRLQKVIDQISEATILIKYPLPAQMTFIFQ